MFQAISPHKRIKNTLSRLSTPLFMTGFALACSPAAASAVFLNTNYVISVAGTIVADV
jgi:hypothetical protein